jgi:hypothetical protein
MLRIHLQTGLMWTKSIEVEGHMGSDLVQLLDDYYNEYGDLPVQLYTLRELEEVYDDEDELNIILDEMIPINGGEYWINGIEYVEEI